jgi:hypothetical protein
MQRDSISSTGLSWSVLSWSTGGCYPLGRQQHQWMGIAWLLPCCELSPSCCCLFQRLLSNTVLYNLASLPSSVQDGADEAEQTRFPVHACTGLLCRWSWTRVSQFAVQRPKYDLNHFPAHLDSLHGPTLVLPERDHQQQ